MSNLEIGLVSFPALLILIFIRVPIGLAMFLVGLVGLYFVTGSLNLPLGRMKSADGALCDFRWNVYRSVQGC